MLFLILSNFILELEHSDSCNFSNVSTTHRPRLVFDIDVSPKEPVIEVLFNAKIHNILNLLINKSVAELTPF